MKYVDIIRNKIPLSIRIKIGPILAYIKYSFKIIFLKKRIRPQVLSLEKTLEEILDGKSVIRFGDGEMSLIRNENLAFQNKNNELRLKLIEVIKTKKDNLLICIPGIFEEVDNFSKRSFWFTLHHLFKHEKDWLNLLDKKNIYGDSFITRPYLNFKDKERAEKIFKGMMEIWQNKEIVLIEGFGSRMGVGNDLFKNTKSLKRILCPSENAFDTYEEIKKEALKIDKDNLVLISLGPTAKVLAYDLFLLGYRVIDIGHLDMEYEMFLRNSATIIKVPYKYFNEINERNPEECNDRIYLEQIIAKIQ